MKLSRFTLLPLGLFCTAVWAETELCLVPPELSVSSQALPGNNDIRVKAKEAQIQQDKLAEFSGNVEIQSKQGNIRAQQALIDKTARQLRASGDIAFTDNQIYITSDNMGLDLASGSLSLDNTEYQMLGFVGRGQAEHIDISNQYGIALEEVSFTTCPAGQEDWLIKASSITLAPDEIWGEARNTRFYLGGIPILYLPYFSFPVSEQRQTGLLFPTLSSSDRVGVAFEQPYYWNIAPNYDATFSPRLMSDRGLQLKTEFRYLTQSHNGQLDLEYLHDDRRSDLDEARYFYRFVHQGQLSENWQVSAEINGLSDDNYIVDLGSDFYNRADTHLNQNLQLWYFSDKLNFSAQIRDFEIIGNHPNSYRAIPELKLDYHQDLTSLLRFRFDSELAHFENGEQDSPSATRLHLAPTLSLPLHNSWGEFIAEGTLLQTFYRQSLPEGSTLDESVSRTLGRGRLYGAINFERQIELFGDQMTQTLEPKMQYLYTSYQNQQQIGRYDTSRLLNDYIGLFRGQEFTGLDRISDSNQFTLGLTTRLLDDNDIEQLRLSLGQIFYIGDTRLRDNIRDEDRSALAAELDWRISSKWFVRSQIQLSSVNQRVERSNLSLDYKLADDKLIQLNHRYVRDISGNEIDQVGLTASWPITKNWHWVGRWYKDLSSNRTIESFTGVQYQSCCWALQFVAQRYLSNRFDALGEQSSDEFESGIALQFVFRGFGGKDSARSLLNEGLFGYRHPYFLNN
ncbi:LPS-assembly protein LptD [Lacimicrobium alkaliphilum]|uniref:LPS-assembly protein LptD n=1 Tax=Lacimicrobium alkaliphilum TaxID=1526571 RepID=A0A0U3AR11_9ALTE|nr:LPS assembly protein LptD [Lacimicrobium alkaliphilum]ALT00307.1 LPS biosynthesis protein [Lacimicrobium alkaliphilum]